MFTPPQMGRPTIMSHQITTQMLTHVQITRTLKLTPAQMARKNWKPTITKRTRKFITKSVWISAINII
jgi:hypothetical protein